MYQLNPKFQNFIDHSTIVFKNCLSEKYVIPKDLDIQEIACHHKNKETERKEGEEEEEGEEKEEKEKGKEKTQFGLLFQKWKNEKKFAKTLNEDGIIKEEFPAILHYQGHFIHVAAT
jgi:hypothetical protein